MTQAQTFAWIFYAVAGASGQKPADFHGISIVADGINHAVPTHKEMQSSLSWLCREGFVAKSTQGYAVTPDGELLMKNARQKASTTMGVWKELTHQVEHIANSSNQALKSDGAMPRT
ncbi:MAG: hypothetical protein ACK5UX_05585 [Burkholderiales bacterium]